MKKKNIIILLIVLVILILISLFAYKKFFDYSIDRLLKI